MTASKVSCPHCVTVLSIPVPIRDDAAFQCPRCQLSFRVQVQVAVAAVNRAVAVLPPDGVNERLSADGPRLGTFAQVTSVDRIAVDLRRPGSGSRRLRIAAVLGGFGMLLILGGVLLGVCLSGDSGAANEEKTTKNLTELETDPTVLKIKPAAARPLIELSAEDDAAVEEMVKGGMTYLKQTQGFEGAWGGNSTTRDNYVAFGGLTLLECGVPADDPAVQKAADYARARCPQINRTYPAALFLLFFDRLNDPRDKERIEELAMRLVAGQSAQGGWTYNVPLLRGTSVPALTAFLRGLGKDSLPNARKSRPEPVQGLPAGVRAFGPLQTPPSTNSEFFRQGGDNSNTQFALLALWAARRHQFPVDHSLDLVVRRFRHSQNADGSFPYSGHTVASQEPSMTCAGLLGLAVGHGLADQSAGGAPGQDLAIQSALAHLSKSIAAPAAIARGNIPMTEMYFLWSVERVAVLYQLRKIGDKDWYHWGLTMLRHHQKPDGGWHAHRGHGSAPFPDTCFALLFLKRVNLAKDLTDKLEEINVAAAAGSTAPGKR